MSTVFSEIFEGLLSVVISGDNTYCDPPAPPLPVIFTSDKVVVWPNELIPAILVSTLNLMPEIGTLPIAVLAVTSAVPLRLAVTEAVSVTAPKKPANAPLFNDLSVWFWNDSCRSAGLPVETPPFAGALGRLSCDGVSHDHEEGLENLPELHQHRQRPVRFA
jgi:hypothetical protein